MFSAFYNSYSNRYLHITYFTWIFGNTFFFLLYYLQLRFSILTISSLPLSPYSLILVPYYRIFHKHIDTFLFNLWQIGRYRPVPIRNFFFCFHNCTIRILHLYSKLVSRIWIFCYCFIQRRTREDYASGTTEAYFQSQKR